MILIGGSEKGGPFFFCFFLFFFFFESEVRGGADYSYRLFNVLCWLWNIYEGAELPSVYFITNTKYCINYLAQTQLFPVLVSHPEMYTHYMHFAALRLGVFHFFFSHGGVHMGQMDFISSIFFPKLSGKNFVDHTLQMYRCLCILPRFSNSGDT